jgi:hypothetical protein
MNLCPIPVLMDVMNLNEEQMESIPIDFVLEEATSVDVIYPDEETASVPIEVMSPEEKA